MKQIPFNHHLIHQFFFVYLQVFLLLYNVDILVLTPTYFCEDFSNYNYKLHLIFPSDIPIYNKMNK